MPRYFLQSEYRIKAEDYFGDVQYSGKHDRTAHWVRDGKVDAGVANSNIVRTMFENGHLSHEDVRILWESPPYTDYVWAVHPRIATEQAAVMLNLVREIFFSRRARGNNLNSLARTVAFTIRAGHDRFCQHCSCDDCQ